MARVYLKGLPQLKRKLERIADKTREETRTTLAQAAQLVVTEISSRAPWQALKATTGWTFGVPPKYSSVVAQVKTGEVQVTIFVGDTKTRTAAWAEHGTKPHTIGGIFAGMGQMHPGTPPQPFFFPGWRAKRNQVRKMLRERIRAAVKAGAR
jgi:HK97 gp10 family phage protein